MDKRIPIKTPIYERGFKDARADRPCTPPEDKSLAWEYNNGYLDASRTMKPVTTGIYDSDKQAVARKNGGYDDHPIYFDK